MGKKSKRKNNVDEPSSRKKRKKDISDTELESSDDEEWMKNKRKKSRKKSRKLTEDQLQELDELSEEKDEFLDYLEQKYMEDPDYAPPPPTAPDSKIEFSPEAKEAIDEIMETMMSNAMDNMKNTKKRMRQAQWKKNLSRKKIDKLQSLYDQIAEQIEKIPTVADILEATIPLNEKTKLVERLYILENTMPDTPDYMQSKNALVAEMEKYKSYKIPQSSYDKYEKMGNALEDSKENLPVKFQILGSDLSEHNKRVVYKRYKDYVNMSAHNHGKDDLRKWLKDALSVPNNIRPHKLENATDAEINFYLAQIKESMDEHIYGMASTKEQILSEIHRRAKLDNNKGSVLGLTGPPGTGKTSIVNIMAQILDIPVVKVSLNGVKDVSKLKGHSFTYISSMMGDIARALIEAKCKNPIIFFDEFDKAGNKYDQSVVSLLMQILDPSNNFKFTDEYLSGDYHVDLSNVWFICSMNDPKAQNEILMDRVKPLIEVSGYLPKEKMSIAEKHFVPESLKKHKFTEADITFENAALTYLIQSTKEPNLEKCGVRGLKSAIDRIVDNVSMMKTNSAESKKKVKLSYHIKKFKLPFVVTVEVARKLFPLKENNSRKLYGMYM